MDWPTIIAWILLALGVILGVGGFIFLYAKNPAFWAGSVYHLLLILVPKIWLFISTRKSPEEEAAWRKEQLTKANPDPMKGKFPKRDR